MARFRLKIKYMSKSQELISQCNCSYLTIGACCLLYIYKLLDLPRSSKMGKLYRFKVDITYIPLVHVRILLFVVFTPKQSLGTENTDLLIARKIAL